MNGMMMPLKLSSDGLRVFGYGVFQAMAVDVDAGTATWLAPGPMELLWRRSDDDEIKKRTERMNARMHERAAICGGQSFGISNETEIVTRLNELIRKWREERLVVVKSCDICPDWTNRAQTGLSVDHVHYLATRIAMDGFQSRRRGADDAHDVPVLIRENAETELGGGALAKWRKVSGETKGFPPFLLDSKTEFFCSLGNGHFSQALNLFRVGAASLWSNTRFSADGDDALREALNDGVESVVLSRDMPTEDRRFVSEMLNRSHGQRWHVSSDGRIEIGGGQKSAAVPGEQFVALSKVLDAEELSCLVRRKLDVQIQGEAQGYFADSSHISG